jgi:hypothetical protein
MPTLRRWIYLLALIGLAACAPVADPTVAPPTPTAAPVATPAPASPAAETVLIRYHRSGGIAATDDTWLIYTSGRVEYTGRGQGHALQLGASQLAALAAAARSPEVAALNESYVPTDTCCDRFLHEITLTLDGQTKTVRTLDAAPDEPPALTNLLAAIEAAVK